MHSETLSRSVAIAGDGATAPRVTLDDIHGAIAAEIHFTLGEAIAAIAQVNGFDDGLMPQINATAGLTTTTLCVLVMRNGCTVIGKSAPASPENFDAEKGRLFAHEDAVEQLWPLMGFALRDRLSKKD